MKEQNIKDFFKRRILSFKYAIKGIKNVIKTETNMKIHLTVAVIVLIFSVLLKISKLEWLFIILAIFAVLVSEMINTAVENILDLLFPAFNPKVGKIKDISAGIVLLFSIMAVIIGLIIFLPKILNLLKLYT